MKTSPFCLVRLRAAVNSFRCLTGAALVATIPMTIRMILGTGFAAIIFAVFFNRIVSRHNAKTGLTGTLHLGHGRHGKFLTNSDSNIITPEQAFIFYDLLFGI